MAHLQGMFDESLARVYCAEIVLAGAPTKPYLSPLSFHDGFDALALRRSAFALTVWVLTEWDGAWQWRICMGWESHIAI